MAYVFSSMDIFPVVGLKMLLTTTSDMPNAKRRHQFVSVSQKKKKKERKKACSTHLKPLLFCAKQRHIAIFLATKMVDREHFINK